MHPLNFHEMAPHHFGTGMLPLRWIFSFLYLLHLCLLIDGTISPHQLPCLGVMNTPGYTRPRGDIILTIGSPLEIFCTLNMSHPLAQEYTSDDIIFEKGKELIDKKYITIVNRTTARLYMESVPLTEETRFHYCYIVKYKNTNVTSLSSVSFDETKRTMVCANYVEVGMKPQNVSNFNCLSRNWESLNCTWKEPNNGVLSVYTLYFSIPGTSGPTRWYRCPQHEQNTCEWNFHTVPKYIRDVEFINLRMEASNKLGNITQYFEFNHYAHVIPSSPRELTYLGTTTQSIYIEWNIGIFNNFKKGLVYRVSYAWYLAKDWNDEQGRFNSKQAIESQAPCRNLTNEPCWKILNYTEKDLEIFDSIRGINVTNLKYPNIVYNFKIEMKSAIAADDLWSNPAYLFARTDQCAPYKSPETDLGSFHIYNERPDHRDVLVYWKQIPPEEQNGQEFRYEISLFEDEAVSTMQVNLVNNSYAKFANLSLSKNYRFVIKSVNDFGSAPYSTEVRVPKKEDILPELVSFNKVSFGEGIYELSWQPSNSIVDRITNFTIFWCQSNREYPSPCSSSLNWTHLAVDIQRQNFSLDPNFGYQFAISVNSHNSTSGMTWAPCTTFLNQLQKMKNVWVSGVGSNFIDLFWKLECSERAVHIKGYNITYCPVDEISLEKCSQPEATFLVRGDSKTDHARITDLRPFTHYKISVAIFTDRFLGPPSDNMRHRTLEAAPDMADVQVQILNITNSSAIVKWNPPTTLNGVLNHYEVLYNNEKKITKENFVTLTDLMSYNSYQIRIVACSISCSETNATSFQTSIGTPAEVTKIWIENATNSTQKKLKWHPPEILAGPSPKYDVIVQLVQIDKNSTIDEFETTETETVVKISCEQESSPSSYTFFVRAKNTNDLNGTSEAKEYFGPWSPAYSIDCINRANWMTTRKIMIGSSFGMLLLLIFLFLGKKGYRKWQEMQDVKVILPIVFNEAHRVQVKQTDFEEEDDKLWKDLNEGDFRNRDMDSDQSNIDHVPLKLHSDKSAEIRRSGLGCSMS